MLLKLPGHGDVFNKTRKWNTKHLIPSHLFRFTMESTKLILNLHQSVKELNNPFFSSTISLIKKPLEGTGNCIIQFVFKLT